jgi:predicted nicotinamide N-methyase
LLDLRMASIDVAEPKWPGMVVATDFHHDVLANLKVCVDLNFPPHIPSGNGSSSDAAGARTKEAETGVQIAKLDWTTFPQYMEARAQGEAAFLEDNAEIGRWVGEPFDLVLASDCVYDPTHAKLLREVAGWVLRLPNTADPDDIGGTFVSCRPSAELVPT